MNIAGFIFLLLVHYACGRGVLKLVGLKTSRLAMLSLSLITGVAVTSVVPCMLQLMHIPINKGSVLGGVSVVAGVLAIPLLRFEYQERPRPFRWPALYEWPYIIVCSLLVALSVWRCYYYPPMARDMLSGPEAIAEFAVREHTLINSFFSTDLSTTNNYLKSPFITGLQIIYKMLVNPFGQQWLSVISVAFLLFLYDALRCRVHPLIAGFLLFLFITIPEVYSYSYIMLYDYSNMVFFFAGLYFLVRSKLNNSTADFNYAVLMLGIATYVRTDTLILVAMLVPMLWAGRTRLWRQHLADTFVFLVWPVVCYVLCMQVFVRLFVPVPFDASSQINPHIAHVRLLWERFAAINSELIFSSAGITVYGYFIFIFLGVLLLDVVWGRKFSREARMMLYGIFAVYFGLAFIGYLLPVADIMNTTKRGMFKLLPAMLLYMAGSEVVGKLSRFIAGHEGKVENADLRLMMKAAPPGVDASLAALFDDVPADEPEA